MVQNSQLFALVYDTITADPELSDSDQAVILAIASHLRNQQETIWCAIDRIAALSKLSVRMVKYVLNGRKDKRNGNYFPGLVERGYVSAKSRGTDASGKRRPNAYSLDWKLLGIDNHADATVGLEPSATVALGFSRENAEIDESKCNSCTGHTEVEEEDKEEVVPKNSDHIALMSSATVASGPGATVTPGSSRPSLDYSSASDDLLRAAMQEAVATSSTLALRIGAEMRRRGIL